MDIRDDFQRIYNIPRDEIQIIRSPYRVCPLGAHIDHQLGHVTGMTINRGTLFAFAPSGSPKVTLRSLNYTGEVQFTLDDVPPPSPHSLPR